jgi:hypothetical protein
MPKLAEFLRQAHQVLPYFKKPIWKINGRLLVWGRLSEVYLFIESSYWRWRQRHVHPHLISTPRPQSHYKRINSFLLPPTLIWEGHNNLQRYFSGYTYSLKNATSLNKKINIICPQRQWEDMPFVKAPNIKDTRKGTQTSTYKLPAFIIQSHLNYIQIHCKGQNNLNCINMVGCHFRVL